MSCTNNCNAIKNSIATSILRVNQFVRTNNIVSFNYSEITVNGLNPNLLVCNIPLNESTFSINGQSTIILVADRRLRVVSVGEIHFEASSVATQVLVSSATGSLASINSLNGAINTSTVQVINNQNNVLEVDDLLLLSLNGAVPTDLNGGIITITLNIL
jgi:hypothetical protein